MCVCVYIDLSEIILTVSQWQGWPRLGQYSTVNPQNCKQGPGQGAGGGRRACCCPCSLTSDTCRAREGGSVLGKSSDHRCCTLEKKTKLKEWRKHAKE